MMKYAHLKLNQDINALAGYYTPRKEVRLPYNGGEILYVISDTVVDSSCCGEADFSSALVPGYIIRCQAETNQDGLPLSDVEPVTDKATQDSIRKVIRETENVSQIEFW